VPRLRADPALVYPFLYGEAPPVRDGGGLLGFLRRLVPFAAGAERDREAAAAPTWPAAAAGEELDLEKAWHALHFLFTGTADGGTEPACFILTGGEDVGDDDDVAARLLRPEQVRDFAAFLAALTPEELRRRFDPARMAALEIYPDPIWERPDEMPAELDHLIESFEALRDFVAAAAAAGDAVVVSVS
jgi:hypothetical protein